MRSHILVSLVALAVAAQACCCCTILGGPQPPYTITPSDEAVRRFEERMAEAEQNASGVVTITVTEEEMTSLLAQAIARQEESSPISEPQVHFRDGCVEVYGTVQMADSLALPGMVAFSVTVTDGALDVTVEEVAVGPLPVPESALQSLTEMINQTIAKNVRVGGVEATITDVQIGAGEMTVTGKPGSN